MNMKQANYMVSVDKVVRIVNIFQEDISNYQHKETTSDDEFSELQDKIGRLVIANFSDFINTAEYLQEIDSIHDSKASRIIRELIVTFIGAITGILLYKYLL